MAEVQSKYWSDGFGAEYYIQNMDKMVSEISKEELEFVTNYLKNAKAKTLLDVGCGSGRFFPVWQQMGIKATGTEMSETIRKKLKGNKYKFSIRSLDLTKGKLKEKFDVVFSTQVLLHILPREIEKAFKNYVDMSNDHIIIIAWYDPGKICRDPKADYIAATNLNSFTHPYYELFEKFGLDVVEDKTITFPSGATNKGWALRRRKT